MGKFPIIVFLILSILVSANSLSQEVFGMEWDKHKKITWDDFQQKNLPPNPPNYGAWISTDLSLNYSWKYSETENCNYEFNSISALAIMNKDSSYVYPWVLSNHRISMNVLNHEQRHFDISEIHARKFNQQVAIELLGEKFRCPSDSSNPIQLKYKIDELTKKQVHEIFDNVRYKMDRMQIDYDGDSDHSLNKEIQVKWNKKIDRELKLLEQNSQNLEMLNTVKDIKKLQKSANNNKYPNFDFFHNPKLIRIDEHGSIIHLISGEIPKDNFVRGLPLELFIQEPDSSIKKHTIPVTAQKQYKYPLKFDLESKKGPYRLVLQYKGQEISSELLIIGNKDTQNKFDKQNMFTIKINCKDNTVCESSKKYLKDETATILLSGELEISPHKPEIRIMHPDGHLEIIYIQSKKIADEKKYYQYQLEFNSESKKGKYVVYAYDTYLHKSYNGMTVEVGPMEKTSVESLQKQKQYIVQSDLPNIGTKCDNCSNTNILIKNGEPATFLMSELDSYGYGKTFNKRFPIDVIIEFPNSEIKKISYRLKGDFEIPFQFDQNSMPGDYKITLKQKGKTIHSSKVDVYNLSSDPKEVLHSCMTGAICHTIEIPEKNKKNTYWLTGNIPENMYSQGVSVEFFIEFPDSRIEEYKIPVTNEKYFETPIDFNQQSQQGEYKITVGYKNQEIQKIILKFGTEEDISQLSSIIKITNN